MPVDEDTVVYCPRCDKPFNSEANRATSIALVRMHVTKAHPDYEWDDDDETYHPHLQLF